MRRPSVSNLWMGVVCLAIGAGVLWRWGFDPVRRHAAFCRATRAEFVLLAEKLPPKITRKQWTHIVAWTLNAHANCLAFEQNIPQQDRDRFLEQLRARVRNPVELETVDWIWDELVRLTSHGEAYSDRVASNVAAAAAGVRGK